LNPSFISSSNAPSFLPSFLSSFLPLPAFLPAFLPFLLSSKFPSFLPLSFLPSSKFPSFLPSFLQALKLLGVDDILNDERSSSTTGGAEAASPSTVTSVTAAFDISTLEQLPSPDTGTGISLMTDFLHWNIPTG
jgi:hypothetical protein